MTTDATRLDRIRHDIELVRKRGRASVDVEDAAWLLTALEAAQAHLDLAEARASEGDLACDQCDWSGPVSDCKQSAGDSVGRCDCPACGGDAESADWWRYELRRREDGWEDERWEMRKERDDLARRLAESGAGCAVMREALEQADAELPACPYCSGERRGRAIEAVNAALSTTAGRALLDELEGLRSINVSVSSVVKLLLAYFKGRDCRENLHIEDGTGEYHGDIGYLELLDLFVALDARKGKGKE